MEDTVSPEDIDGFESNMKPRFCVLVDQGKKIAKI